MPDPKEDGRTAAISDVKNHPWIQTSDVLFEGRSPLKLFNQDAFFHQDSFISVGMCWNLSVPTRCWVEQPTPSAPTALASPLQDGTVRFWEPFLGTGTLQLRRRFAHPQYLLPGPSNKPLVRGDGAGPPEKRNGSRQFRGSRGETHMGMGSFQKPGALVHDGLHETLQVIIIGEAGSPGPSHLQVLSLFVFVGAITRVAWENCMEDRISRAWLSVWWANHVPTDRPVHISRRDRACRRPGRHAA